MSIESHLGITWEQLQTVVDPATVRRWARSAPALGGYGTVGQLRAAAHDRSGPATANDVIAALLRLAATDGGNDEGAAAAACWLLTPGAGRVAASLARQSDLTRRAGGGRDLDAMVAAQLWIQVRTFRWRTRSRGTARGLLQDLRRAVLDDLGATTGATNRRGTLRLIDATPGAWDDLEATGRVRPSLVPEPQDLHLPDLLAWAVEVGVLAGEDGALLWDLVLASTGEAPGWRGLNTVCATTAVARTRGVTDKTIRRRRDRALAALRAAAPVYVDACA